MLFRSLLALGVVAVCAANATLDAQSQSFYDLKSTTLVGNKPADLGTYRGTVTLVVNLASYCGYTPQYKGLEALHRELHPKGFSVLGFPSNDFGGQEPGTGEEIAEFCKLTYFVEFPMIEKGSVTGPGANAFFKQLAAATGTAPAWNFHKYLIAPDGKTVHSFGTRVEPDSREVMGRLVPMLK